MSEYANELDKELDQQIQEVVNQIAFAINDEEDVNQDKLVLAIQKHRKVLLDIASKKYVTRPGDPKLLEAITTLVSQIEKSVRDNRKERLKKQEMEDNKVSFRQMVDALDKLSTGEITVPVFSRQNFILDPTKSLLELSDDIVQIRPGELTMGNQTLDFDGNIVK